MNEKAKYARMNKLADLWAMSSCFEEFMIKQAIIALEMTTVEYLAFKQWNFHKRHPSAGQNIAAYGLSFAMVLSFILFILRFDWIISVTPVVIWFSIFFIWHELFEQLFGIIEHAEWMFEHSV